MCLRTTPVAAEVEGQQVIVAEPDEELPAAGPVPWAAGRRPRSTCVVSHRPSFMG